MKMKIYGTEEPQVLMAAVERCVIDGWKLVKFRSRFFRDGDVAILEKVKK